MPALSLKAIAKSVYTGQEKSGIADCYAALLVNFDILSSINQAQISMVSALGVAVRY